MPRLSQWFLRAALLQLVAGWALGAAILAQKGLGLFPWSWRWLPLHMALLLEGWMLQLAFGVAFWILPRFRHSRGDVRPAWAAFWLLNAGIVAVGLGGALGLAGPLPLAGRLLEVAAVVAFALHAWPRVKPPAMGTAPPPS